MPYLCNRKLKNNGLLAEWLGTGLQNRSQQFESARDLNRKHFILKCLRFFCFRHTVALPNEKVNADIISKIPFVLILNLSLMKRAVIFFFKETPFYIVKP